MLSPAIFRVGGFICSFVMLSKQRSQGTEEPETCGRERVSVVFALKMKLMLLALKL